MAADSCRGEGSRPDPLGLPSTMLPAVPPGACAAATDDGFAASPFFMLESRQVACRGCLHQVIQKFHLLLALFLFI